jgi:zinc transporter, ZIP family
MSESVAAVRGGRSWRLWAFVPLILLTAVVALFTAGGSSITGLLGASPPMADEFDIRRVEFHPGEIRIRVTNPQRDDLTIATVTVDDAIVPFEVDGPTTLSRLRSSEIVVQHDWVEEEPITVGVTSSTGIQTTEEIPAAVQTPTASAKSVFGYGLIGFLVGVVPVALLVIRRDPALEIEAAVGQKVSAGTTRLARYGYESLDAPPSGDADTTACTPPESV